MTAWQIVAAVIGVIFTGGVALAVLIRWIDRAVYGQAGELRQWYMTIEHGDCDASPDECWMRAISELEVADAELLREWGSHDAVGGRVNREYQLHDTIVLLELDRWNGLTISGQRELVEPIAARIRGAKKPDD